AHAAAVEAQRRGRLLKRFAVRGAVVDRHRAEPDGALVGAREVEFARQQTRHRILVDAERMAQAVDVAPYHAQPRVHLFAAVVARIAEREQSVRPDLRIAEAHDAFADVDVAVLDHDARAAGAPWRVPRAQILAAEDAFDAGPADRAGHPALELAAPAERHRARLRAEVGDDAGEQLIAFLPVAAGHVERQPRSVAICRGAVERDERALGREPSLLDRHVVR